MGWWSKVSHPIRDMNVSFKPKDIFKKNNFLNPIPVGTPWGQGGDLFDPRYMFGGKGDKKLDNTYFNKIQDMEHQAYDPYIQHGQDAYNTMNPIAQQMTNDPSGYLSNLQNQYQQSPMMKYQDNQMLGDAAHAAAAGGMKGSIGDIDNQSHLTDTLMSNNMQDWMKNTLNLQQSGMGGLQNLYGMGFDANQNMAGDLSNLYGQQSERAFQNSQENNKNWFDKLSGMFSGMAGGMGMMSGMGGGGAQGGAGGGMPAGGSSTAPSSVPSRMHL